MTTKILNTKRFPSLFYRKSGSGPFLILLHGFPFDGSLWENIRSYLEQKFTVLIPDIPGCGQSSRAHHQPDLSMLADSLREILTEENASHVVIAGHSMGGYLALAFAERYKEYTNGLSLIHSTATADSVEKKSRRQKSIELLEEGGQAVFIRSMIPGLFSETFSKTSQNTVQSQMNTGFSTPAENLCWFQEAMMNRPDRTALLRKAPFPVQWIAGAADDIAPVKDILPQSRLARINFLSIYNDCAHMSMWEQPLRLQTDLAEFTSYCYNY